MESVRPARSTDHPRLIELVAELLGTLPALRGGPEYLRLDQGAAASATDLVAAWAQPSVAQPSVAQPSVAEPPMARLLLAGQLDGVTVGLASVSGAPPARRARIECCYVEPPARGVGLGSALMTEILRWCDATGLVDIDAPALPGDRSSKQLFEAAGFKARLLVLHRSSD